MKRLFILLMTLYVVSLLPAYAQKPGIDAAETLIRAARAGRRVPAARVSSHFSQTAPAAGVRTLPVTTPSFQVPASYYRSTVSNPLGQKTKWSAKSQSPLSLHGPRTPLDTQPIHDYLKKVVSASQSTPEKPVFQTPQQPPQQTVTVQGPADDPIAYFRQLAKEGGEVPLQGDPYEAGYVEHMKQQRINANGGPAPSKPAPDLEARFIREQYQPITLLPKGLRQEFLTTVAVANEMAQMPLPRRKVAPTHRKEVLSGEWNPTNVPTNPLALLAPPKNPWAEASQYDYFDPNNYLDYKEYDVPFHSDVQNLQVLVASDEPGFVQHLQQGAKQDPHVHITAASNGDEAILLLKQNPDKFHIVLTDIHMHNGNGMVIAEHAISNELPCYVVAISKASANPATLFLMGFDGSMSIMNSSNVHHEDVQRFVQQDPQAQNPYRQAQTIFAYLSNMVGNGGYAYPKE